ncbi:uncharacterized protein LOC118825368 [Colossoma macropomum]|uniref:uncharacterized protein LOC118825368 n=1 Tax=Colossoma macropomum TaxID=42526 RepID=UPI001865039D|nr:uncharacterized protein LOC118825368 [Colossoma macropomum]
MLITVAVLGVTVEQNELSWTKPKGKRVFISCKVTGLTTDYIHWYQQKDGEALKRILYVKQDGSGLTYDSSHPQLGVYILPTLDDIKPTTAGSMVFSLLLAASVSLQIPLYRENAKLTVVVAVLGLTVEQPKLSWTKQKGKRVFISCAVTDMTTDYVHWYQQKDGEALKRILYVNKAGTSIVPNADHPEAKDFSVQLEKGNDYVLKVDAVKPSHSAVYYCATWDTSSHIAVLGVTVEQSELFWTKPAGKSVYISCKVTDLRTAYVHWYQQKDEALRRILYIKHDGSGLTFDPNHPQAKEFSVKVDKKSNAYDLKVDTLKTSHSAVYYCACWESGSHIFGSGTRLICDYDYKVFGSGTRLIVTEKPLEVKPPQLSAYPIVKQDDEKRVLLCQARDMAPNLVRFTWKEGGNKVEGDLMEQNDESEVRVTSMLIVDKEKARTNQYTCFVQHESNTNEDKHVNIPKEVDTPPKNESVAGTVPTCAPSPDQKEEDGTNFASSELVHRLYLFNLTYVSLLVKNVLYFCAVGVLLYKRRAGNSETLSKPSPTSN